MYQFKFQKHAKEKILMTEFEILKKLKVGDIDEKKLVALFATPTVKQNYKKNGHFIHNDKYRLLEKARKFCEIIDNKDRTFTITKVYDSMLPTNFSKMNSDLYKYICPLILSSLINGHDENNKVTLTIGLWAREIKMVNQNYDLVKHNPFETEKEFQLLSGVVYDFCSKCDNTIDYYIIQALKYLQSAGLIIWREVYFVQPTTPTIKCDNVTYVANKTPPRRVATEEDMEFYARCIETADKRANIKNGQERYYSKKSNLFRQVLLEELNKGEIQYIYKSYEAYYVHLDRCKSVLKEFDYDEFDGTKQFNDAFADKLMTNAQKRNLKKKFALLKDEYLGNYADLCEIVIDNETEYLRKRLLKIDDDEA